MTKLYFKILDDKEVRDLIKDFQKVSFRGFGFGKEQDRVFSFHFQSESDADRALTVARAKNLCLLKGE